MNTVALREKGKEQREGGRMATGCWREKKIEEEEVFKLEGQGSREELGGLE